MVLFITCKIDLLDAPPVFSICRIMITIPNTEKETRVLVRATKKREQEHYPRGTRIRYHYSIWRNPRCLVYHHHHYLPTSLFILSLLSPLVEKNKGNTLEKFCNIIMSAG